MGNILGLATALISIGIGVAFGAYSGGISFVAIAYSLTILIVIAYYLTIPSKDRLVCKTMPPAQCEAFRTYHLIIRTPGFSTMSSSLLNFFRLTGIGWGIALVVNGHFVLAAVAAALFPLTSLYIVRFDPYRYMTPAARQGSHVAIDQLRLIDSAKERYEAYHRHASDPAGLD